MRTSARRGNLETCWPVQEGQSADAWGLASARLHQEPQVLPAHSRILMNNHAYFLDVS